MNIKKALFYLAFISFFALATGAHAAPAQTPTTDSRYLVKSTSNFWKKSFQVRNVFDYGFTADLTDWQLKLAKVFGVEVVPVKKLNILVTTKKVVSKPFIKTPTTQVGWGVEALYGDTLGSDMPSGGEDVNVAVLDTGILTTHPDLKARITACSDFSGVDTFTKNSCDDKNGHGTQVAGIIAADGGADGKGMYGVAPASNLMIYKTCASDGTCFSDDVAVAIRHAVDDKAQIIVLSLGSDSESQLINEAVAYATEQGVMVISAVGNDGPYVGSLDYPASQLDVVSVGSVDSLLNVPTWSARGGNLASTSYSKQAGDLEFVAPGVNIESTSINSDYVTLSGTSMAAAHLAGLAAKEWQIEAEHPAESTRELLHRFSHDILPLGDDNASGWGMPSL
ncbi:MAG: S8 family serine peptidase [Patescibacteria group bacterium]